MSPGEPPIMELRSNTSGMVDPGFLGVIILASASEVRGFDPGRGRWIFSERKNPQYDFLWKGSMGGSPRELSEELVT